MKLPFLRREESCVLCGLPLLPGERFEEVFSLMGGKGIAHKSCVEHQS